MWTVFGLALVSYVAGSIEANEYYIHEEKTQWSEAVESCKRNGSILAVLDSHYKLVQLASSFSSQGYNSRNKYWIGLMYNASSGEFVWSSGVIADVQAIANFICGKQPTKSKDWCFLVKNDTSLCFEKRKCDHNHRYGYICQHLGYKDLLVSSTTSSNAASTVSSTTSSNVGSTVSSTTSSNAASTVSSTTSSNERSAVSSTTSSNAASTVSSPTSSNAASTVSSTASSNTASTVSTITSNNAASTISSTTSSNVASTVSSTASSNTASTVSTITSNNAASIVSSATSSNPAVTVNLSSSVIADTNPLLQFSSVMSSLNPKDPLSLKLATEAYKDFAASIQSHKKIRNDVNLIYSAQVIEEFAFKYASFNLNATNNEERKENEHIVLQVSLLPKGYPRDFTFTAEDNIDEAARITLPSYLFQTQDTVVVNVLYRDLHEFVDNLGFRNDKIHSMILGSDIGPSKQDIFTKNVTIVFRMLEENNDQLRQKCVFWKWNFSHSANGSWSGDGCTLVESNMSHVVCTCNHLTNFAILMNIKKHKFPGEHKQALSYITYIGVGISLLGETITIIAYLLLLCSSHDQQSHVHINLVATLAVAQSIFLAGINATQDQELCVAIAALIHYFYLSSFCWMLIEGVMLYLLIIEVYNTELNLRLCYCFSLGFPGLVVGGTLIIAHFRGEGIHQYTANKWCWLSTEKHYIWSFAGPVIMISAVNIVVFCIVVKEMVNMTSMQSSKLNRVKTTVKACIVLFPLLGVTWLFGLLSIVNSSVVTQYIFTLLNSIQGLMIFVFHCVRNTEVKLVWHKKLKKMKIRASRFFKIGSPSQTSTSGENNSNNKQRPSEVELSRKNNKVAPVEG